MGEDRAIPRRDFLQGALVAGGMTLAGPLLKAYGAEGAVAAGGAVAAQDMPGYYPPLLNGMRGSHPGSFESAHALRDGGGVPRGVDTGETYDLVVVGAGISGLSAAQFYRARTSPRRASCCSIIMTILAGMPSGTSFNWAIACSCSTAGRC